MSNKPEAIPVKRGEVIDSSLITPSCTVVDLARHQIGNLVVVDVEIIIGSDEDNLKVSKS